VAAVPDRKSPPCGFVAGPIPTPGGVIAAGASSHVPRDTNTIQGNEDVATSDDAQTGRLDGDQSTDMETEQVGAPSLGLWDAVSIIIGIVVGTAIFKSPTLVFQNVSGPLQAVGLWSLGGLLSLIGAFCYAELATTYPRSGGDYHYLTRAFGSWMGFLFGWAQLSVILTGSIASMAYAFADYAAQLWGLDQSHTCWLAAAAIVVLSAMNLLGLMVGKVTQNLLSIAKVLGLGGVVLASVICTERGSMEVSAGTGEISLGLALVFVLYAFGGWNDAAFVASEVRDRQRNIPWALFLGVGLITAIYVLVIISYLLVLGFEGARQTRTPASDVLQMVVGPWGGKAVCVLVMISALGAINGLILTGSRIYASLGADHRVFSWLGHWNQRRGAPIISLVAQGAVAVLLVLAVGTARGRATIDAALNQLSLEGLPWEEYFGGFETLVAGTAPVFWMFFLLTGISLFVLRYRDADRPRPFSAPWYPLPPLIFCATCLYMLYSSLDYARGLSIIGLLPLAIGVPLYGISLLLRKR
jgi:amino acid transporter